MLKFAAALGDLLAHGALQLGGEDRPTAAHRRHVREVVLVEVGVLEDAPHLRGDTAHAA